MKKRDALLRYALIAIIAFSVIALGWWYVFLKSRSAAIEATSAGRGFGTETPTGSTLGSAYQNILSAVNGVLGGASRGATSQAPPRLHQVSPSAVAGMGFVGSSSSTRLYFVERGTGYVFSTDPATGEVSRLANTLRTKTYEAKISRSGGIIERGVDENGVVQTFMGYIAPSSDTGKLTGANLEPGITSITWGTDGKFAAYAAPSPSGSDIKTVSASTSPKVLYQSGVTDWLVMWPGDIVLVQKPAAGAIGTAYTLTKGILSPLSRGPGLTISQQGADTSRKASSTALLWGTAGRTLTLSLQVTADAAPLTIPLATTADKCAWGTSGTAYCAVPSRIPLDYPDSWYRGEVHTSDAWWVIDSSAATWKLMKGLDDGRPLDVRDPIVDDSGTYLAFINSLDNSVWLLRLTDTQ